MMLGFFGRGGGGILDGLRIPKQNSLDHDSFVQGREGGEGLQDLLPQPVSSARPVREEARTRDRPGDFCSGPGNGLGLPSSQPLLGVILRQVE